MAYLKIPYKWINYKLFFGGLFTIILTINQKYKTDRSQATSGFDVAGTVRFLCLLLKNHLLVTEFFIKFLKKVFDKSGFIF